MPSDALIELVLVGGGGTSADVLAIVDDINREAPRYLVRGLLDDALTPGSQQFGVPVLGGLSDAPRLLGHGRLVDCLGSPRSNVRREALLQAKGLSGLPFASLVHPRAVVAGSADLGEGCILYPNVVLLAQVRLGCHVTVLANCVLNHGVCVDDFGILASGVNLSGRVQVGRAAYLGCGCNVREDIRIGDGALVGLGSAVVQDVAPGAVVAGVPARVQRSGA
jgi:sugar O-acyltransferase (sialic acid O-acetyltransferase NeuD family)